MVILDVTVVPLWCLSPKYIFKLPLRKSIKQVQDLKETIQLHEARLNAWYEEGCEVPPFKSGPPTNLGAPGNSGLHHPLFQPPQYHSLQKVSTPSPFFKQLVHIMANPLF